MNTNIAYCTHYVYCITTNLLLRSRTAYTTPWKLLELSSIFPVCVHGIFLSFRTYMYFILPPIRHERS